MSERQSVKLTAMPLLLLPDGHVEGRDSIGAHLIREEEGARALLQLVHGEVPGVILTLEEAGRLRDLLGRGIARSTPLSDDGLKVFEIMAEVSGHPVQQVAETLGIDLATATREDGRRLSEFYGARMGDKH